MEKYKIIKVLGDGAFGTVYKAINTKTQEVVAIKTMKNKYKSWEECLELREIKSLRKITHPNIIKMHEVLLVSGTLHLVFEYLDSNLYEEYTARSKAEKRFTEAQIKNMLFQLASGLAHMHKQGFFHRDLKPENLLVLDKILKICDFGLARQIRSRPPFTDYVSTRWYRAPQLVLRSTSYNSPVDVFAFGCIAAELFNLAPLFPGSNDVDQLNRIVKGLGTPRADDWEEGFKLAKKAGYHFPQQEGIPLSTLIPSASPVSLDLIRSTLQYSSRKRITMQEILRHQFFTGMQLPTNISKSPPQIKFQQKQEGTAIDRSKHQKDIDAFRETKTKMRMTRRQHAIEADPFKMINKSKLKEEVPEDIDDILKDLEEKRLKRQTHKMTKKHFKKTRQRFYTQVERSHGADDMPSLVPKAVSPPPASNNLNDIKKYVSHKMKHQPTSIAGKAIIGYAFQPSLPTLSTHSPVLPEKKFNSHMSNLAERRPHYLSSNKVTPCQQIQRYRPKALSPLIAPLRQL